MSEPKKLTRIIDKLVQVGPKYLDQTLRKYVTENTEYRLYTDTANNTYAVFSYFSSGTFVTERNRTVDILMIGGGGGSTIGNVSGGSGGGEVVSIRGATLTPDSYVIEVGAGGAGGTNTSNTFPASATANTARGAVGNSSTFRDSGASKVITVLGGGAGGHRNEDVYPSDGGCGGGAGGADLDTSGQIQNQNNSYAAGGANTSHSSVTSLISNSALFFSGTVERFGNNGGNSDAFINTYNNGDPATYHGGGGGGAGQTGIASTDDEGGNGGDGVNLTWVDEVFQNIYKVNTKLYWAAGGGGAATQEKEPGDGGQGGGGGGAAHKQAANTAMQTFTEGKGGIRGWNDGYNSFELLGGAGAKNTGSGAGGSHHVPTTMDSRIYRDLTQGNHGGSGFVMLRVLLDY